MKNFKLVVFLGLFLFLSVACSENSASSNPPDGDLEEDLDLSDLDVEEHDTLETESEFLAANQAGPFYPAAMEAQFEDNERQRTFGGVIWYPTSQSQGETFDYLGGLVKNTNALKDAPIADLPPMPLIVFSHGHLAFDAQSYALCEHLASHGYIVVACTHKDDTFMDLTNELLIKSAMDRPQDLSWMIDSMLEWNGTNGHMLHESINPEHIGAVGHSFGGYSTLALLGGDIDIPGFLEECESIGEENWKEAYFYCSIFLDADVSYGENCSTCSFTDDRIKVAVPMAPAFAPLFIPGSLDQIEMPVLLMAGGMDDVISPTQVNLYFSNMDSNAWYWELEGATHFTFSSVCDVPFLVSSEVFQCGKQTIESARANTLINTATTAFLGLHLKSDLRYKLYFEQEYLSDASEVTFKMKE